MQTSPVCGLFFFSLLLFCFSLFPLAACCRWRYARIAYAVDVDAARDAGVCVWGLYKESFREALKVRISEIELADCRFQPGSVRAI